MLRRIIISKVLNAVIYHLKSREVLILARMIMSFIVLSEIIIICQC